MTAYRQQGALNPALNSSALSPWHDGDDPSRGAILPTDRNWMDKLTKNFSWVANFSASRNYRVRVPVLNIQPNETKHRQSVIPFFPVCFCRQENSMILGGVDFFRHQDTTYSWTRWQRSTKRAAGNAAARGPEYKCTTWDRALRLFICLCVF